MCPLCNEEPKIVEILFIKYKYMHALWMFWRGGIRLNQFIRLDIKSCVQFCISPPTALIPDHKRRGEFILSITLIMMKMMKNEKKFKDKSRF